MLNLMDYVVLALNFTHTNYGSNAELMCGDVGKPVACVSGVPTASGEDFDIDEPTAAVPMPRNRIINPMVICLYNPETGMRANIRINDKKNPRFIATGGLDLSPKAYELLVGERPKRWSSVEKLKLC